MTDDPGEIIGVGLLEGGEVQKHSVGGVEMHSVAGDEWFPPIDDNEGDKLFDGDGLIASIDVLNIIEEGG